MLDALFNDALFGPCVLTFDGHTVETFRANLNATSNWRSHRRLVTVAPIEGVHRRGFVEVRFVNRFDGKTVHELRVPPAELPAVQAVLDALRAAG